jgi:carboxypeptidase C (cathepsin A)
MARLTGLSREFLELNDLRVSLFRFNQELLKDQQRIVSRFDERFTGYAADPSGGRGGLDITEAMLRDAFTPVLNDYLRRELGYKSEDVYYVLGGGITGRWNFGEQGQGYADVTPSLESAFVKNPAMKLYVAEGYFDGATPYWGVEYTLAHLNVPPEARKNIRSDTFAAGHMMYIDTPSMTKLRADLRQFIDEALGGP